MRSLSPVRARFSRLLLINGLGISQRARFRIVGKRWDCPLNSALRGAQNLPRTHEASLAQCLSFCPETGGDFRVNFRLTTPHASNGWLLHWLRFSRLV